MLPVVRATHWLTAISLLATLYAHTFLGMDASDVTPLTAVLVLLTLSMGVIFSVPLRNAFTPTSRMRQMAGLFGLNALMMFAGLDIIHGLEQAPAAKDLGEMALHVGVPFLLIMQADRRGLFVKLSMICVVVALADAAWNFATLLGLVAPVARMARYTEYGEVIRYPGLTGNTLAAGTVSFIAVCYLAFRFSVTRSLLARATIVATLGLIFVDMILIDARRFTGVSLVAVLVTMTPWVNRRAPLHIIAAIVAGIFFYLTFSSVDPENIMRGNLMAEGWNDVKAAFWLGSGIHHVEATGTNFQALWASGVTESGALDLAKAYGVPATAVLFAAAFMALAARRRRISDVACIFAMLVAEMECNDPIDGFLGATVFFLSFVLVVFEEQPRAPTRIRVFAQKISSPIEPVEPLAT
jgi:hypothetical protein